MHVVYERCCGIDVHKKFIVACLCLLTPQGAIQKEVRTFTTMTADLLQLLDWLKQTGCTHVALESTGVYWRPIHNLLETEMEVLLVNAQHIKAVPGRKTDVKDAEWIADLLQHGLLRASFIPARPQRDLRELTRYRSSLVGERARLVNRIQKILEDTNIKLTSVVTDITGVSGRAILGALLQGQTDPQALASLARGRLRKKKDQLKEAVQGTLRDHHRFLLSQQLEHLDMLDTQIAAFDQEIARRLESEPGPPRGKEAPPETASANREPSEQTTVAPQLGYEGDGQAVALLDAITGINERIAQIIVAEIGIDMNRFPSEAHLASWVGLCPGTKISAGKRLSSKTQKPVKSMSHCACRGLRVSIAEFSL
jgi:transposase